MKCYFLTVFYAGRASTLWDAVPVTHRASWGRRITVTRVQSRATGAAQDSRFANHSFPNLAKDSRSQSSYSMIDISCFIGDQW